jgi:hypothetical protein
MAPAAVLRRSTLVNDRYYPWSLDSRNAERVRTQFLGPVKEGIILSFELRLILPTSNGSIYTTGNSRCFCHPQATHFKEFRKRKGRRDKTMEQLLETLLELKQKVVLGNNR